MRKLVSLILSLFFVGGISDVAPAHADESFFVCPPSYHSGIATLVTSCPFAENVRAAYLTQGGPIVVAYSPVTGMAYTMQCAGGFIAHLYDGTIVPSMRCAGGNNAVVIVF
jgi:hypothetical protein